MNAKLYLGIDCGTQSTKILILDAERRAILGRGQAAHTLDENAQGRREQHPRIWTDALEHAFRAAVHQAAIDTRAICGIGISGQQHGMVALDGNGEALHPAKLWCDTETAQENAELINALGGEQQAFARLGLLCQPGYTASKILWLRKHHPERYRRIAKILLPHDYLNHWLTGEYTAEAGDASGTGYFDIRKRDWAHDVFAHIAPELDPYFRLPADFSAPSGSGKVYIWFTDDFHRRFFANPKDREHAHCHVLLTDREDKILKQRQDFCIKLLQHYRIAY